MDAETKIREQALAALTSAYVNSLQTHIGPLAWTTDDNEVFYTFERIAGNLAERAMASGRVAPPQPTDEVISEQVQIPQGDIVRKEVIEDVKEQNEDSYAVVDGSQPADGSQGEGSTVAYREEAPASLKIGSRVA